MTRLLLTAAALASLAGAANAQTSLTSAVFAAPAASRVSIAPEIARANALRAAGIAKTSVDHSFSRTATASLGFLCGLQPRADEAIGSAHGFDSQGRFLGAKLSVAFR